MDPINVPDEVRSPYRAWRWSLIPRQDTGGQTWRLEHPNGGVRYLKVGTAAEYPRVLDEAARMEWAHRYLPVPEVVDRGSEGRVDWLLTAALPGQDATDPALMADPAKLVPLLAQGLRRFHRAPVDACPFDFRIKRALDHVRDRVAAGRIRPEIHFHPEHAHLSVAAALAELERLRPPTEDLVVCHGDYCLPNALTQDGAVTGFVDLGELGIADRWWDLAVATWSVTWNLGPGFEGRFLEAYGADRDADRVAFYRLLYDLAS